MKVKVLKSSTGKVVATFESGTRSAARLEPQARKGHKVHEVELPRNYIRRLDSIYKKSKRR
jgi:hypothetical protein